MTDYHYGITIQEYREKAKMTQTQIASIWPKSNGDKGVSVNFVQIVEYGERHIDVSQNTWIWLAFGDGNALQTRSGQPRQRKP